MNYKNTNKGFTLLEMLLVIAVIAILAGIVIVAINPAKQLGSANNAKRFSDVKAINDAIKQHAIDNGGIYHSSIRAYPTGVNSLREVCNSGSSSNASCPTGTLNLSFLVPDYLQSIPRDPSYDSASGFVSKAFAQISLGSHTGYFVGRPSVGSGLIVAAPLTQNLTSNSDKVISVGADVSRGTFNLPNNPGTYY